MKFIIQFGCSDTFGLALDIVENVTIVPVCIAVPRWSWPSRV